MTTVAAAPATGSGGVTFGRVLRSEWIKFTSLRSTFWTSAVIILIWLGFAFMMSFTASNLVTGPNGEMPPITDELRQYATVLAATVGVSMGVLVAAIQGVLAMSGEYSTGMIRSSLTAVPSRLPVLAAKGIVVFVWMFLLGLVSTLGSYLIGLPFLGQDDLAAPLGAPELLAFVGAAGYLGLVALLGVGVGTAVRSGAGGIAIVVGLDSCCRRCCRSSGCRCSGWRTSRRTCSPTSA